MKSYLNKLVIRRERSLVCDAPEPLNRVVRYSKDAATIVDGLIGAEHVEVFLLIALNARHKIIGYNEVARGSLTSCAVSAGDVARAALITGAPCFVVAHNHPSGDPGPSPEDIALTKKLRQIFKLLDLVLLDHVIVGYEKHSSFLDLGLMVD